jgi:hypothetical protein
MSSFTDTSKWKRKNSTTLTYSYIHKGETHEGSSEMEPQTVSMQLERLSVLKETSWRLKDKKDPDSEAGFFTREFISALGILDNCILHAITLDENPNQKSVRLDVNIFPASLDQLRTTSVADSWAPLAAGERPEEGWLKDEIGQIRYHSAGEYHEDSSFLAILLLSQQKFDELAQAIKQGTIQAIRGRVELFFQAAVFLVVLLVLGQVFDWLKG